MPKRLTSLSVRSQIVLITLIIALPTAAIIIVSGLKLKQAAVTEAFTLSSLIAERVASEQRNIATGAEQLLVTLSQLPEIKQYDRTRTETLFRKLVALNPRYTNIFAIRPNGMVWATAKPFVISADLSDRRYFKQALASGKFSAGEYIVSRAIADKPVFNFAYPCRDAANRIIGVIAVGISLDAQTSILDTQTYPPGSNFLLVDHNGTILVRAHHPDVKGAGSKYPEQPFREMVAGPEEHAYLGQASFGDKRFISYRKLRLKGDAEPYMYVRAGIPQATALAPAYRTILISLMVFGLILLAAFVTANSFGGRYIVDRIQILRDAVQRFSKGHKDSPVAPAIGGGELGKLAQNFDEMADELEQREQALRDSEEKFRNLVDNLQNAVVYQITGDQEGNRQFVYISRAVERINEVSVEQVLADAGTIYRQILPEYHAMLGALEQEAIKKIRSLHVEVQSRLPSGRLRWFEYAVSPRVTRTGQIIWDGIEVDITDRKQAETELHKAKLAAEAANTAKTEFLANMSHEIRTPMNGVVGNTQLLRFTNLDSDQQDLLNCIEADAHNLVEVINDVLDITKIEAGKLELEQMPFSLRGCITDMTVPIEMRIRAKSLSFRVEIAENVPDTLLGDHLRLKQILRNLLGNAVKFTETGGIALETTLQKQQNQQVWLCFCVRDSGIGIRPEALERIFEPFVQADASVTRRFGGTGLGLSICQRIARLMGGAINVESTEGTGSAFRVTLPFMVSEQPLQEHEASAQTVPSRHLSALPLHILLVEDSLTNRVMMQSLLQRIGHTVRTAANGAEALEQWRTETFDVILMDIQMPVMDGEEALRVIRQHETGNGGHTAIIAMTAHALHGQKEHLLRSGFDGYVSKPVDFAGLVDEIEKVRSTGQAA